jgi:membrane protease YdiL (CAAX protease family)
VLYAILIALALAVAHVTVVVLFDRGDWRIAGLEVDGWRPLGLALALAAGALVIIAPAVGLYFAGQVVLQPGHVGDWTPWALNLLLLVSVLALVDELVWRGYLFGLLADRWSPALALAVTSVGFGAIQAIRPDATPWTIGAVVISGVFFGAVRLRTGSVAAAWLAHVAFDWTQVALVRGQLSDLEFPAAPGVRLETVGPDWLTGGAWGIEGGMAAALSVALVTFLLFRVRSGRRSAHA